MNHGIYRLVFNRERNSWVAVAENVRGRGKKSSRRRLAAVVLGLAAVAGGEMALAADRVPLPVPSVAVGRPFVFAGAVNGGQPTTVGNTMTINTASKTLGLNWRSFDIASGYKVEFKQPDASSRVLNRIWDNNPTQIMGQLKANGQVYLVNQNGILFGAGSQVNVGGLVASSLNLTEAMTNKLLNYGLPTAKGDSLEFAWDGDVAGFNAGSVIVEAGAEIRSRFGGRVVLIAPKTVENKGLIARSDEDGAAFEAILAAGGKVILTAPDDPSLRGLLVETHSVSAKDALGNNVALDGVATNSGQINTGAGGIASLAALAVNQKGVVNATKAVNINGTTMLVSGTTETDRLTINQRGSVAEIDWVSGFNVGAGKIVEVVQSSPSDVLYNYVNDASRPTVEGLKVSLATNQILKLANNSIVTLAAGPVVTLTDKATIWTDSPTLNLTKASQVTLDKDISVTLSNGETVKLLKGTTVTLQNENSAVTVSDQQLSVAAGQTMMLASNSMLTLANGATATLAEKWTVALQAGAVMTQVNNPSVTLADSSKVILASKLSVKTASDFNIKLADGSEAKLAAGSEVNLAGGANVALVDGSKVMLASGGKMSLKSTIANAALAEGSTVRLAERSVLSLNDNSPLYLAEGSTLKLSDGSSSVALASGRSSIDGILKANGQFLLINDKGIDIGSTAKVSANNFVASALGINPSVVSSGLLMQDGVSARAFYLNEKAVAETPEGRDAVLTAFRQSTVNVKSSAKIESASNGYVILAGGTINQAGTINTPKGQVLLAAGADVYLKPAFAQAMRGFSAEVNPLYVIGANAGFDDPWVALSRGADANAVTNTGNTTAAFGNITLVGHEITQAGLLSASTSSTANGSIRLLARDQVNDRGAGVPVAISSQRNLDSNGVAAYVKGDELNYVKADKVNQPEFITGKVGGSLTLAAGSRTQVLLDSSDGKTLTAEQTFISSSVEAMAKQIVVAGNESGMAGAVIEAKGGRIQFKASEAFDMNSAFAGDPLSTSQTAEVAAGVGIFVGDGAKIDASGAIAQKQASDLFIEVELRGDEFADNPVQRNSVLRGEKAWVDIRDKVSIANLSGWTSKVAQTVEERAAAGGTISLGSTGSVIVKKAAELDVSGGLVDYAAGTAKESLAITAGGKSYRLNDAPVGETYVVSRKDDASTAANERSVFAVVSRNVSAYREGKSAGTVDIQGHSLAVDGKLKASTTVGEKQRNIGEPSSDRYAVPLGGNLIIRDAGQHFALADRSTASDAEKMAAYSQAQITFVNGAATAATDLAAGDSAGQRLELSSSLVDAGFSRFDLRSDGRIDIPANVTLNLAPGGSFKADGRQVYVAGDISVPGGTISLSTRDMSLLLDSFPNASDAQYSTLVIDGGANLSTAGRWINDYLDGPLSTTAKAIKGGTIELSSAYDLDLREGSSIDVSGGARLDTKGKLEAGNAGAIVLTTGGVKGIGFEFIDDGKPRDASLFLDGSLSGYSLGAGGKFEINTSALILGEKFVPDSRNWSRGDRLTAGQVGAALDDEFFNRGGFYDFKLVGRDGVNVVKGAHIAPLPISWSLATVAGSRFRTTGSDIGSFAKSVVLHSDLRSAPTKLSLATRSLEYGDLVVDEGAYLGVSPTGTINLESQAQLTVLGTLEALAGSISLSRPANRSETLYNIGFITYSPEKASESIYLGANSKILAGGATVLSAATRTALEAGASSELLLGQGKFKGSVLDGGRVSIDAGMGYLISREGSLIDVSGTQTVLNVPMASGSGGVAYPAQTVGSAGGSVALAAREGMFLDGKYKAAGGNGALGGVFSLRFADTELKSNPWEFLDSVPPGLTKEGKAAMMGARNLTLYQSADAKSRAELWPMTLNVADYLDGSANIDPAEFSGKTALDLARLQSGGFGSWYLTSQDAMSFSGNISATVNNHLRLDAASFSATSDATRLALKAGSAEIGNYEPDGAAIAAALGKAEATIKARDIGLVGTFTWGGFGSSRFVSQGEMHFDSLDNNVTHRDGGRKFNGQMSASGSLELAAARLSPSTYSDFRVDLLADPAGSISITRPAGSSADVSLSPAGRLEFAATTIDHQGTVTAPLGEIIFTAPGGSVTLGSGSVTSVAADRDMLLGYTINSGTEWKFDSARWKADAMGVTSIWTPQYEILKAPTKSILIDAANSKVATGAKLDLSGGGEAVAWEFSAGPIGKSDALVASSTTFAILPGNKDVSGWNGFSATDSGLQAGYNVTANGSAYSPVPSLKAGDRIVLGDNPAGISGSYVLLPARYALLPGAYLITVKASSDSVLGAAKYQADGSWLVSGTRVAVNADGSSTAYSQRALTLELAGSNTVESRAKYLTTTASEFFYDTAGAVLPGDAGQLTAIGRSSLVFDPSIVAMRQAEIAAADGRKRAGHGLELDLAAPKMLVSDAGTAPDETWSLLDQSKLNALGASSLLLGGARTIDGEATRIDTIASQVVVKNSGVADTAQTLVGPELMLTAKDEVKIEAGSRIEAVGDAFARKVLLNGDGAFLSVAAGAPAVVTRKDASSPSTQGDLILAEGATVAGQALIFDATRNNRLAGIVELGTLQADKTRNGGFVTIGAGRINIVGDKTKPTDGLILDNAALQRFSLADQVRLTSYTTLDLYGNASLGTAALKELAINATGIAGHGDASQTASLTAKSVLFENLNPDSAQYKAGAALGSGALLVTAETIRFGGNATAAMRKNASSESEPAAKDIGFAIRGFADNAKRAVQKTSSAVNLAASGDLRFESGVSATGEKLSGVTVIDNAGGSAATPTVAISAARVTTVDSADHLVVSSGVIRIADSGGVAGGKTGLGGALELRGKAIDVTGRIETPSGKLVLAAKGSDVDASGNAVNHVTLGSGAFVAAEGSKVAFADTFAYAPAGTITLSSINGNVDVQNGSVVSVSAAPEGGDAGQLRLEAKKGTVSAAAGSLRAMASAADKAANRGELIVDAKAVALDQLAAAVRQSLSDGSTQTNFTEKWDIRRRVGDLDLSQTIKSSSVKLAADIGNIDISGRIDASGSKGGSIELYANRGSENAGGAATGGQIDLRAGSVLDAHATELVAGGQGTAGRGGTVLVGVSATNAAEELNTGINFEAAKDAKAAALIDVSTPAGSAAAEGKVTFRAPRKDVVSSLIAANGALVVSNDILSIPLPTGYRLTPATAVSSLGWGTTISVRLPDNSSGQLTLDLSGLGSKSVLRADGSVLADGDLVSATTGKVLVYDGSAYRISPTASSAIPATPTATAGTASAYTLTGTLPATWGVVAFTAKVASAAAPTLKIGTATAKKILNSDGSALAAGAIKNNAQVLVVYDGTNFRLSPTTPTIARQMNLAPGTSGINFQVAEVTPSAALAAGTVVTFTAQAAAKAGATLRVGNNGDKALLGFDGTPLTANAFLAQQGVVAVYDGTAFRISAMAAADTGTTNNYKITQAVSTATDFKINKYTVTFRAKTANTTSSKLEITTADTAKTTVDLKREDGSPVGINDIKANQFVTAVYTVTDPVAGTGEFRIVQSAVLATGLTTDSTMAPVTLAGNVNGASTVALEGFMTTRTTGDLVIGAQQQAKLQAGATQAAAAKGAIFVSNADADGHLGLVFRAGEEVRATGAITVSSDWNLATARYADQPGALTLRAEGDLNINGTLSDGFVTNVSNTAVSRDAKLATSGDSWTYRLVAGADTAAASLLETRESAVNGSITVATNKIVRTGTGDIDMAARRDIKLFDRAAVYTAGIAASSHPDGFSPINGASSQNSISSIFPDGGGDVTLTAGERIVMVSTGTTPATEKDPVGRGINQWLFRAGGDTVDLQWWPRIAPFQQGVAAFGGGNVALDAGTDIKNFTAVIPTNGRVPTVDGERQADFAVVQGGGDLSVQAGGTVVGGQFYAETGQLRVKAAELDSDVALALGNAAARVVVSGDAALGNVFNPLWASTTTVVVNSGQTPVQLQTISYREAMRFGTYGASSAIDLVSVSGKVILNPSDSVLGLTDAETMRLAPSHVKIVALNGDIEGSIIQAPGEKGQLDLLAAGSIKLDDKLVRQLDISPDDLPSVRNPLANGNFKLLSLSTDGSPSVKHSSTDWHSGDSEPSRLVALTGNISGQSGAANFAEFSEAVHVEAAGNVKDLSVVAQHRSASDVTSVSAGGNIEYVTNSGNSSLGLAVSGPGRLEVTAGGSIVLKDSRGIVTRGNLDNPYLPEIGASIFAMAGAKPDYNAFRNYLKVGAEVSDVELREHFYTLLRDLGREALNGAGEASYEKGRAVISVLFPKANISGGDIDLFASQIKTEQGGNVDLLTPGGSIVVGVADPSIEKKGSEQGLFTLRDGAIRAYVKDDFQVNQSRVFTLDGGDILVWADTGSIDAGSGAKTVSSTPPPALVIRNGQVVLDTTNSVSGSGIGVLASRDDTPASDMDLFAPQGAIDAGDAGLRSTGNINLGARVVLNASNIQAAGSVAGAPAPVAAAAPVAIATTPTNNENKALEDAAPAAGKNGGAGGMLTVEVLDSEPASAPAPAPNSDEERKRKSRSAG